MKKYILPLILLLGLLLRFIAINQSLWLDEAIGALVVKHQTFVQILTEFPRHDNHPPLYYLALKGWTDIFGYSEIALRSLSVVFGVGMIFFIYKIGKIISPKMGTLAAILLATSPFAIYYSQEARMYPMAAFLAAAAFYLFLKKKWFFFSFFITALVFTDYMPVFLIPAFWLLGFLEKKDRVWWKSFLVSQLPLVVLGVIWLPVFLQQSEAGKWLLATLPAWEKVAGGATLKQLGLVWTKFTLGRISFSDKVFYYALLAVFSIPFLASFWQAWKERKKVLSFWIYLLFPLFLGFFASFFFPAFIYFRYFFVVPAFYLLVSWGLINFRNTKIRNIIAAGILLANFTGWFIYVSEPNQQREQWRQAVAFVESKANKNEMVIFNFTQAFAPYEWYASGQVVFKGVTDSISANPGSTRELTQNSIKKVTGLYYFEYLWELHDPGRVVEKTLKEEGFIQASAFDFPGVGIISYWRRI